MPLGTPMTSSTVHSHLPATPASARAWADAWRHCGSMRRIGSLPRGIAVPH
jgi:hypothetical protein